MALEAVWLWKIRDLQRYYSVDHTLLELVVCSSDRWLALIVYYLPVS